MTTLKTRAFELQKGDRFILVGRMQIVRKVCDKFIHYASYYEKVYQSTTKTMSRFSKELILLVTNPRDISVPIPFELLKYKSNNNGNKH